MSALLPGADPRLISYTTLRRRIGFLGVALPIVLAVGHAVAERAIRWERSLSTYYHTEMRNWLVGGLCAIGVYLWAYKGYGSVSRADDRATNAAGLAAVLVAFLPVAPEDASSRDRIVGAFHIASAAVFFLLLAYISLAQFTKTAHDRAAPGGWGGLRADLDRAGRGVAALFGRPAPGKASRNWVYSLAGSVIVLCLVLIALSSRVPEGSYLQTTVKPVFWLEGLAVIAFGVSWLVKGEGVPLRRLVDAERAATSGRE